MTPLFKAKDMINLGMQEFYIKETIDGETYDPFSAETLKVFPPPHASFKQRIKDASRKQYAMRAEDVKKMLQEEQDAVLFRKPAPPAGWDRDDSPPTGGETSTKPSLPAAAPDTPPEPLI